MTLYEYRPLETKSTIRLLELHPPKSDDQALRVSLRHELLDGKATSYEALSYTWGSSQIMFDLQCIDGTKFTTTENLNAALTALRLSDKSRVLWVDALCINQLDVLEKNVQVPLMRDIYKNGSSTVIYLGDEADDSQLAMEYAESLYTQVALEFVSEEDMANAILPEKFTALAPPPNEDIARAITHLVVRPWFRRAWIVQEFAVAKIATFVCGSSTCHWAAPYFAWSELRQHHIDMSSLLPSTVHLAGIHNILMLAEIRAGLLLGYTQSLEVLAPKALLMSSELPHDKLYSLLGLSDDEIMAEPESGRQKLFDLLGHEVIQAISDEMMEYKCSQVELMEALRRYKEDWAFYSALQRNTAGMALCRTLTGSLALVPDTTREDDMVCIISGAAVPFVLRPLDDDGEQKHNFKLIGEAVIPGKMYGEYVTEGKTNIDRLLSGTWFDREEVEICIK